MQLPDNQSERKIHLKLKKRIFNEVYLPYLDNDNRYLILRGGAGSGKSRFLAQRVVYRSCKYPGRRTLVVRKVANSLRDSVIHEIKTVLMSWKLLPHIIEQKTERVITLPNGSEILFRGLDSGEKIKSISGIGDIWIEEASELDLQEFLQLDLRLRGKINKPHSIALTFNPVSIQSWLKKHFYDKEIEDCVKLLTTYKDNKFLDDFYRQRIEKLKEEDEMFYQIYALGEWGVIGETILKNYEVQQISLHDDDYDRILCGLDWGYTHPAGFLKIGYKEKPQELYILAEIKRSGLTNTQLIQRIAEEFGTRYRIVADNAEPDRIREFRNAGFDIIGATKGKNSVKHQIDFLRRCKIYIHPQCSNFLNEIEQWKYKTDKDGNLTEVPVEFNDDLMAALRYAVEELREDNYLGFLSGTL